MRTGRPRTPLAVRAWALIDTSAGPEACWPWLGTRNDQGYGVIHAGGSAPRRLRAHRVAYESERGSIPTGLTLDHLCRVRHCCNPAHLEPVTQGVNSLRGDSPPAQNARKTHCPAGHLLAENTYRLRTGKRVCSACGRARDRARRRKAA